MAREWRREQTQRRGGETFYDFARTLRCRKPLSGSFRRPIRGRTLRPPMGPHPDAANPRPVWNATLRSRTGQQHFAILQPTLMAERGELDYPDLAEQLQTTPQAARVAVHRFRKRFRESFRNHVTQTLSEEDNLEEELNKLMQALL